MPRYKQHKMTEWEAADILKRAYDTGYARGLTGEGARPTDPFSNWGEWARLKNEQTERGRSDGYREFVKRVHGAIRTELPPPYVGPPPKVTFDPGYLYGGKAGV